MDMEACEGGMQESEVWETQKGKNEAFKFLIVGLLSWPCWFLVYDLG